MVERHIVANNQSIENYADSMFLFESINPRWITSCARYLIDVFGDALQGATVLDYAFGRGNWSLAFREAGAAKVIAVDAAKSNVTRFSNYLDANSVTGIEVREGNLLVEPIEAKVDIIWAYGILHHINKPREFMRSLIGALAPDGRGLGLVYAYNEGSLRHVVVNLARRGVTYNSYEEFLTESYSFSHFSRLRARDDLTAPHICWYSESVLAQLVCDSGVNPLAFVESFGAFENTENQEFRPHCLLFAKGDAPSLIAGQSRFSIDNRIISDLGNAIFDKSEPIIAKKIAVGLMNTHFDAVFNCGYEKAVLQDFLFLFYVFHVMELTPKNLNQDQVIKLAMRSLSGSSKISLPKVLQHSLIANHLTSNSIRI